MKTRPYVGQLSRFGGLAAILLSLMPCAENCAQDVQVPAPRAATATGTLTSSLAACSADGECYAVATPDGRIKCGHTREGARAHTLLQCEPRVIQFSPDSRLLATAGGNANCSGKIKIWQVADGALLFKLDNKTGGDPLLSFSSDGLLLASTGANCRINLWELPKGTLKGSVTTDRPVSRLAISKEGTAVVAVFADGSVQRFPVP
jgi:WD40 repeat protein